MEEVELVIIGAGPAGIGAALEAWKTGLQPLVIDNCSIPGGQYYKQLPAEFIPETRNSTEHRDEIIIEFQKSDICLLKRTEVWGIFPENGSYIIRIYSEEHMKRAVLAKKVILAAGAFDRPVPFPGWTLPGVMTAGAVMNLIKNQRVIPGKRVLLSGTGPLQLVLAARLVSAGAEVVSILEANPFPWHAWRYFASIGGQSERLNEGWQAWNVLRKAGVKIQWGHSILRAEGFETVSRAVIGKTGGGGKERLIEVDTICLGFGFIPSSQLASQAGCLQHYDEEARLYLLQRDERLESTKKGFFLAGDCAGLAGKDVACWEGRLAAIEAASQLGYAVDKKRLGTIKKELNRQRRFVGVLNKIFPFPYRMANLITDDTVICRCEQVKAKDIKKRIDEGAQTTSAVKMLTRAGMGYCQGRMCGISTIHLLEKENGMAEGSIHPLVPHPPVIPVPVSGLVEAPDDE